MGISNPQEVNVMESIRISRFLMAVGAVLIVLGFWGFRGAWGLWQDAGAHNQASMHIMLLATRWGISSGWRIPPAQVLVPG